MASRQLKKWGNVKPPPGSQPDPSHPLRLNRSLVLNLPFNEGVGAVANNSSTYPGNNGALNSTGVTWAAGRSGWALKFAGGASDYVQVPSSMIGALVNAVSGVYGVTAACWIYPTSSLTAYQSVFDATTVLGQASGRQLSAFLGGAANHLYVAVAGSTGTEVTLTASWVLNVWQYLMITCDGTTLKIYRNGVQVGSTALGFGAFFAAAALRIGGNPSGGGAAFVGSIDRPVVFNRVLLAGEILSLYTDPWADWLVPTTRRRRAAVAGGVTSGLLLKRRRMAV